MKKRELAKMRKQPREDLVKRLNEERKKMRELKFNLSLGKASNIRELRLRKKTIAQLLTIIKNNES
ncbi:MAG: 50S ribosomal protein L29 [Candidatus Omnitrophota bacterium]|nr:MAG: 50S ribosomal protein L29 [Candidatus Omnitrophota bacterium]